MRRFLTMAATKSALSASAISVFDGDHHHAAVGLQRHLQGAVAGRGEVRPGVCRQGQRRPNAVAPTQATADRPRATGMPQASAVEPHSQLPTARPPNRAVWNRRQPGPPPSRARRSAR